MPSPSYRVSVTVFFLGIATPEYDAHDTILDLRLLARIFLVAISRPTPSTAPVQVRASDLAMQKKRPGPESMAVVFEAVRLG